MQCIESVIIASLVVLSLSSSAMAESEFAPGTDDAYRGRVVPFLTEHCFKCHDQRKTSAGLRIDQLGTSFLTAPAEDWVEVMDAINLGKMPPEDEPRPDPETSFKVVKWIAAQLMHSEKAGRAAGGQIPMRRLNRDEFANTVRDLLQLDEKLLAPIVADLPGDGKAEGFDRLGVALFFDQTQIERTLSVAEKISRLAIVNPDQKPTTTSMRFEAELARPPRDRSIGTMGIRPIADLEKHRYDPSQKIPGGPKEHVVTKDGVIFSQGRDTYVRGDNRGRLASVRAEQLVTEDGYYRIRVRGGIDRGTRDEPITLTITHNANTPQESSIEVPFTPAIDEPDIVEVTMFLRRGADDQRHKITLLYNHLPKYIVTTDANNQLFRDLNGTVGKIQGARAAGDETTVAKWEAFLKKARARARAWQGPMRQINPKFVNVKPPRVYIDWMEVEGPIRTDWPPKSHQLVLFKGDEQRDPAYAREIVQRFLPRAYRRPVTGEEVAQVTGLIDAQLSDGRDFYTALRIGLQRILTSPTFLFLNEPAAIGGLDPVQEDVTEVRNRRRRLNDYELAGRLSYFLWSTMPDEQLFDLVRQEKLSDPVVLNQQVDRMLADAKTREFVENFAGQWLNVREFGSVMPAENLYSEYDSDLEESSRLEAYEFFEEILANNLPITSFLDSDFVVINERLARHYEIDGVTGDEFRRVSLRPEHNRGGVFGMAGLMTLLADGTRTLPVRRAAWIVENLFNDPPPPPPPNAGEVQPNTAGEKLTVRERLERHRNEPTCASCHATLDPYGLALENYDAIGKWRTIQNGEGFRRNAPELDVSGELPSGRRFASLREFKAALLAERKRFARAFSERMMTYALGRPVGYSDRETIESIVDTLESENYRIQTLIRMIVQSDQFQTK